MSYHGHEPDTYEEEQRLKAETTKAYLEKYGEPNCRPDILEIALDVHMTNTGNSERPEYEQEADKQYLHKRLREWKYSPMPEKYDHRRLAFFRFDEAVRNLIRVVLEEE